MKKKIKNFYLLAYKIYKNLHFFKIFDFVYIISKKKYLKKNLKDCGKNLRIGNIYVYEPQNITIGNNVTLNDGVFINGNNEIKIGNNVAISPFAQIHTGALKRDSIKQEHTSKPIIINDNVRICSGSIILGGIEVGKGSIIAANSVLNKNVPENELRGGVPAKKIKSL